MNADRNLLFGILALQLDFVTRDALVEAMNAWVLRKATPLDDILVEQQALSIECRQLLDALVKQHLKQHDNLPEKSLAALSSPDSIREELTQLGNGDLDAALAHLSAHRSGDDPQATRTWTAGEESSAGTRFRVLRPHARGGVGEVYVARDEELHRDVALKEIQARHADNPSSRARFVLEAEITGGLEHPGIVPVYGLGTYADGRPFYAMRFIKGDSLRRAIERFHNHSQGVKTAFSSLEFRKLLGRFIDVCNAIDYAHSRGVLHRDLKPGNIMLGKHGETLVVDWGLAKVLGRHGAQADHDEQTLHPSSAGDSSATQMGSAIGTPQYMSPEQAEGRLERLGPASDIYGLGATLYTLLTGRPAIHGDDLGEILVHVANGNFSPPRAVNAGVPRALDAICLKAMAVRPDDRYASVRALADDLEHWLADEPVSACRETIGQRAARWVRRHRGLSQSAAAATVIVAIVSTVASFVIDDARRSAEVAESKAKDEAIRADKESAAARLAEKNAQKARRHADVRTAQAVDARHRVNWQRQRAERDARLAKSVALAAQSREAANLHADQALLLAASAVEVTTAAGESATTPALQALRDVLSRVGGQPMAADDWRAQKTIVSPDGRWLVADCSDKKLRLWDLQTGFSMTGATLIEDYTDTTKPHIAVFSQDNHWLVTLHPDESVRVWDLGVGDFATPAMHFRKPDTKADSIDRIVVSGDSEYLIAKGSGLVKSSVKGESRRPTEFGTRVYRWRLTRSADELPAVSEAPAVRGFELAANGQLLVGQRGDPPGSLVWEIDAREFVARGFDIPISPFDAGTSASPDGRWLASTVEGEVLLLDSSAVLGATPMPLGKSSGGIDLEQLFFSPDSRWLISGPTYGEIVKARIWELSGSRPTADDAIVIGVSRSRSVPMAVSSDSRWLFLAGERPIFWDLKQPDHSKAEIVLSENKWVRPMPSAVSPDQKWLAAVLGDNSIQVWDWMAENPASAPGRILKGHTGNVSSLTFSADGRFLVSSGLDGTIRRWDLHSPTAGPGAVALANHCGYPTRSLAIGGAGRFIIGAQVRERDLGNVDIGGETVRKQWSVTPRIWDCDDADSTVESSVARLPTGGLVRIGAGAGWLVENSTLWPVADQRLAGAPRVLGIGDERLVSIVFSADGRRLAARGEHHLFAWDLNDDPFKKPITRSHAGAAQGAAFRDLSMSLDGRYCACCLNGAVFVFDLTSDDAGGDATLVESGHSSWSGAQFSRNGKWLLTVTHTEDTSTIRLWSAPFDPRHPAPAWTHDGASRIKDFAISPSGKWIAAEGQLWRVDDKKNVTGPMIVKGGTVAASFNNDGRWLFVRDNNSGRLFDLSRPDPTANAILLTSDHPLRNETAWSDDGRWLAAVGTDQTIMLWDLDPLRTSKPSADLSSDHFLTSLVLHGQGFCTDFQFTRDGQALISAWGDKAVRFHRLSHDKLVDAARVAAGRELTSLERQRFHIDQADETPQTPNTLKKLAERQPQNWEEALDALVEVEWNRGPLVDFVDQCGSLCGLAIAIDHDGLNVAGQSYDSVVTLSLKGISLRTTLELLLEPLGLGLDIQDELLTVTRRPRAPRPESMVTKVRQKARAELNTMLDQVIEFDCENQPLSGVLEHLAERFGKNIFYVNHLTAGPTMADALNSSEITFKKEKTSIRAILQRVLPPLKLRMQLHDDLVEIVSDVNRESNARRRRQSLAYSRQAGKPDLHAGVSLDDPAEPKCGGPAHHDHEHLAKTQPIGDLQKHGQR